MRDPRLTAANGRVAHVSLENAVTSERFVEGRLMRVNRAIADLWRDAQSGPRQRQLLFGEGFLVLENVGERAFGVSQRDGYAGYVAREMLGSSFEPTHFVSNLSTHCYRVPDLKAADTMELSFGSRVRVVGQTGGFVELAGGGFLPGQHVRRLDDPLDDPAGVAEQFLGVPYLWGGNSSRGVDCSGLVQAALLSCGIVCPGDSDLQEAALGTELGGGKSQRRGDLLFWKGHVAMALDHEMLIHANAQDMAVAREPTEQAVARIVAQGGGPVTSRRRL